MNIRGIRCVVFAILLGVCAATFAQEPKAGMAAKKVPDAKTITNSIGMKMVLIPAGEFMMGSSHTTEVEKAALKRYIPNYKPERFVDLFEDEYPQHHVRITQPFYLGATHVTLGQFRRFVKDAVYEADVEKNKINAWGFDTSTGQSAFGKQYSWQNVGFQQTDDHPVMNVSWKDAVAFCRWLSRKEGVTYRLPTEAEWEYACRAGTTSRYYNGDDPEKLTQAANIADASVKAKYPKFNGTLNASDGYVYTSPVRMFKPNAFGLYDMHGNAMQWCADWYSADYYGKSPKDDPIGPNSGELRVLRGGAWVYWPGAARSANRTKLPPDEFNFFTGFRVARTP